MNIENVKKGEILKFRIFNSVVHGEFVSYDKDSGKVKVKTTVDFMANMIGENQDIHIGFLVE